MSYTNKALAFAWLLIFGLFALSGSGMVAGQWVLLLVAAALVMPALMLTLWSKPERTIGAIMTSDVRTSVVSSARRRSTLDSSGIDVYRWENEGGAQRTA